MTLQISVNSVLIISNRTIDTKIYQDRTLDNLYGMERCLAFILMIKKSLRGMALMVLWPKSLTLNFCQGQNDQEHGSIGLQRHSNADKEITCLRVGLSPRIPLGGLACSHASGVSICPICTAVLHSEITQTKPQS